MKNQEYRRCVEPVESLSKISTTDYPLRGAYCYGEGNSTIDPGSIGVRFIGRQQPASRTTRTIQVSPPPPTRRVIACSSRASYSRSYFSFGTTTVSAFWKARPSPQNFTTK